MILKAMTAALLASAATVAAAQPAPARTDPPAPQVVFIPAPAAAPEPARLAAAEGLVAAMWSDELFISAIDAAVAEHLPGASPTAPNPRDPHHAERLRLTREATTAEYIRMVRTFAPELRALTARFYARNMSAAELQESARFYASPAGQRFIRGSVELSRHVDALRAFHPTPSPELIEAGMRLAQRIETETRHLAPPPPPRPAAREDRRRRPVRTEGRPPRIREPEVNYEPAPPAPPPAPPPPPPPPPPPADPARLAAANRAALAIWPNEAFAQPLQLETLAQTVMALPLSSFGPIPIPGVDRNGTIGQAIEANQPRGQERIRIIARILSEELPRVGPLAAPLYREALTQLYARTFTVAELDDVTRFYETPAGRALARQSITAIADPDFVRGMILMTPRMMTEGMGSMVRIGQATAHLPPPPPPPAPAPRSPSPDGGEDEGDED